MRKSLHTACFLAVGSLLLAGCGTKGPLTLPPAPATKAPAAPASQAKPADDSSAPAAAAQPARD